MRRLLNAASQEGSPVERIPWLHNLTPEQIGIDHDAIARIIKIGVERGEIRLGRILDNFGVEATLEALVKLHGANQVRECLDRLEAEGKNPSDPAASQNQPGGG